MPREQRPGENRALDVSAASIDCSTIREGADTNADPHCCLALTFTEREELGRLGRTCGEDRCAKLDAQIDAPKSRRAHLYAVVRVNRGPR